MPSSGWVHSFTGDVREALAGVLTERQKEVAEEQRRGAARFGVTTGTTADASQTAWASLPRCCSPHCTESP